MPSCGCGGTLNGPQHPWKVIRSQQLCGTPAAMTHHDSEEISQSQLTKGGREILDSQL